MHSFACIVHAQDAQCTECMHLASMHWLCQGALSVPSPSSGMCSCDSQCWLVGAVRVHSQIATACWCDKSAAEVASAHASSPTPLDSLATG